MTLIRIFSSFCFELIFPEGTGSNKGEHCPTIHWWTCGGSHTGKVSLSTSAHWHNCCQQLGFSTCLSSIRELTPASLKLSPPLKSSKEVPCIASSCFDDLQTCRLDLLAPYQLANDFDKFSWFFFFFLLRKCLDFHWRVLFTWQLKQEAIIINYHVRLATVL